MPAKGDGITRRKDGRYMARYTVQTPGGPKRKTIYGRQYGDVENELARARGDAACGIVYDDEKLTVGGSTWRGGSKIPCATRCAVGPTSATRASCGCMSSLPSGG